jgi:hypothetical protein
MDGISKTIPKSHNFPTVALVWWLGIAAAAALGADFTAVGRPLRGSVLQAALTADESHPDGAVAILLFQL